MTVGPSVCKVPGVAVVDFLVSDFGVSGYIATLVMLLASIHLMWTESLSAEHVAQYYVDNPLAPAAPLMWLFCGAFWHLIATEMLFYYTHEAGWAFLIFVVVGFAYLGAEVRSRLSAPHQLNLSARSGLLAKRRPAGRV